MSETKEVRITKFGGRAWISDAAKPDEPALFYMDTMKQASDYAKKQGWKVLKDEPKKEGEA